MWGHLIFLDGFWVVHITFVGMFKLKFLAQFLVNHPFNSVVSRLIIFLCYFAAFTYYVIDRFVSITTQLTFANLLLIIYYYFDRVDSYGVVFDAIRRDSVSLISFPFLSHVQVFSCKILFICHLKYTQCCFPSRFCFLVICSIDDCVVRGCSDGCDQYSSALVYLIFESLYQ